MYYGENFYIFGSKDENKLDAIYSSVDGIYGVSLKENSCYIKI